MSWISDIAAEIIRQILPEKFGPTSIKSGTTSTLDYSSAVCTQPVCRAATTAAMAAFTRVGNTITANADGALAAIDGVTLAVGDVLLIKDEDGEHVDHGPYEITSLGGSSSRWTAARVAWFNASHNATAGTLIYIIGGTTNARRIYACSTFPVTLNTTDLAFTMPFAA